MFKIIIKIAAKDLPMVQVQKPTDRVGSTISLGEILEQRILKHYDETFEKWFLDNKVECNQQATLVDADIVYVFSFNDKADAINFKLANRGEYEEE